LKIIILSGWTPVTHAKKICIVTEFLETRTSQKTPSTKRPKVSDMTEEEQLNAAIAASLGNSNTETESGAAESPSETQDAELDEEIAEEERQVSILDSIEANKRDEPTDLKASTRIQLRLAGTRFVAVCHSFTRHIFFSNSIAIPNQMDHALFEDSTRVIQYDTSLSLLRVKFLKRERDRLKYVHSISSRTCITYSTC
jgi:hypothetical protein